MTTFQVAVYAILRGFTQFLPVSWDAHSVFLSFLNHWSTPSGPLLGALALGAFLSVLVYFRHDWASMISCFLQVLIFRKRPMTLDERLPLFILIATLPVLIAGPHIGDQWLRIDWTPLTVAASFAAFGLVLAFTDSMGRKKKGMFDWNWLDSLVVGIVQLGTVFVGFGSFTATWVAAMSRNYNREAAAKFSFFTLAPILAVQAFQDLHGLDFHAPEAMPDVSWLSFGIAIPLTFLVGLLAIGGFMKHIQRKGQMQYVIYRWVIAAAVVALYWFRS